VHFLFKLHTKKYTKAAGDKAISNQEHQIFQMTKTLRALNTLGFGQTYDEQTWDYLVDQILVKAQKKLASFFQMVSSRIT
jgi:hypothetical protein